MDGHMLERSGNHRGRSRTCTQRKPSWKVTDVHTAETMLEGRTRERGPLYTSVPLSCLMIIVQDAPGGAENTRCNSDERQPCLRGNYRQFFVSRFSEVNGERRRKLCAWNVEAPWKCPCPGECASLWRLPSLFGDDTHAAVAWPKWAREHGLHTECGPLCRWVENLAHRHVLEQGREQKST